MLIAIGPPAEATDSYKSTINCRVQPTQEFEYIPFTELCFEDLIPK
jgi:hypothetical protein